MNVPEGAMKLQCMVLEVFVPMRTEWGSGKVVGFTLRMKEFVDGGLFALVTDLFESALCKPCWLLKTS